MSERNNRKSADDLARATGRPKNLRSLIAAVGASAALGLLGILPASANASIAPATISASRPESRLGKAKLRLNRVGSETRLAQDGHASHESHASHSSHYSGGHQ